MYTAIKKLIASIKVIAYGGLAIMIYMNIIGSEGVAEILKVENPTEEGLSMVGVLLPQFVLYWTFGTVILEIVDNLLTMFERKESKSKYITHSEFNDENFDQNLKLIEIRKRIYKLEEQNKNINS